MCTLFLEKSAVKSFVLKRRALEKVGFSVKILPVSLLKNVIVFWLIFWLDYQSSSGNLVIDILTSLPGDCSFGFPRMMLGLPRPHCCRSLLAESAVRKWEVVSESGQSPGHRLPSLRCHHSQTHPQDLTPTVKQGRKSHLFIP